ncbi:MAG: lytic murein transglycosylase, partial [Bryobacteraceae bacterium]
MIGERRRARLAGVLLGSTLLAGGVVTAQEVAVPGSPASADAERASFAAFLTQVRTEAATRGISAATIEQAFDGLDPLPIVVERDRSQPETVLTIDQYVRRRLTKGFVATAREMRRTHRELLAKVSARYGLPADYIVAIWGMESNFGRFTGVRPVVQTLATLAWEGRRAAFFTSELFDALRIVDAGHIELASMKGSWAGAMGQTQFMPSSYLVHAQDFDEDGRRDIWSSLPDVFASIANYMRAYGWSAESTWGREVRLPPGSRDRLVSQIGLRERGCRAARDLTKPVPLAEWQALGVRTMSGRSLPKAARPASLLRASGHTYLVYPNYDALL